MTNTNKGGYQILDLGNVDLTTSPTIEGLYELIEGTKKPIRLTRINLGGVEKHDVVSMPVVSGTDYVFQNVYGYDITINSDDEISVATTAVLIADSDGNLNLAGDFTANSIVENMSGYSFVQSASSANTIYTPIYAGVCKNGNKITFVYFATIEVVNGEVRKVCDFYIPASVGAKLYPVAIGSETNKLLYEKVWFASSISSGVEAYYWIDKVDSTNISIAINTQGLTAGTYNVRFEFTFLLSDNLVS